MLWKKGGPYNARALLNSPHLMETAMPRPTVARIDLDALAHNVGVIRQLVGERKICAAVKADAYGHGAPIVCHAASAAGVDMFAVAMTEEAVDLRAAGIQKPVILLSAVPTEDIEAILENDITACITDEGFARELSAQALKRGVQAKAHVNVEGKEKKFHDLAVGEKVTFWVSEKRMTAAALPSSTSESWAVLPPK